jgi:hypothetical protein
VVEQGSGSAEIAILQKDSPMDPEVKRSVQETTERIIRLRDSL